MSSLHFHPIFEKLEEHRTELEKMFAIAGKKQKDDNLEASMRAAYKSVYEADEAPVVKFAEMKASPATAKTINNALKLADTFSSVPGFELDVIKARGAEKGFTEDESMFLYNLSKYAKALDNLRSQKDKAIELIIAEVA
ncbi:hypothetical protein [Methanomethylovorans sp.]|uniref:hypothetical protein n=1 Tax=Methanomethylovorans sp. TaxID=2758717 RepID=UPI002FDCABD8